MNFKESCKRVMEKKEWAFLCLALAYLMLLHVNIIKETYYTHDEAGYAYNTLEVLEGRGWYGSTWHNKPPGINVIYLAAFLAFGRSFLSIHIAALLARVVSVILLFLLARIMLRKEARLYYLLPFSFTLFCTAEAIHGHTANTETFLATFEIAGILLLGIAHQKNRLLFWFVSGFLLGLGFMVKQAALPTWAAGAIFIAAASIRDRAAIKVFLSRFFLFLLGFAVPFLLFSSYFLSLGVFDKFINYSFTYNIRYQKEILAVRDFFLSRSLIDIWRSLNAPIIILGIFSVAGIVGIFKKRNPGRVLILAWFFASMFFLLRFSIFRHYFIGLLAPFVCLSVIGASDIAEKAARNKILSAFFFTLLAFCYLAYSSFIISQKGPVPPAYYAVEERFQVARYLKGRTALDDFIFVWDDNGAGAIYIWSGLKNPTGFRTKYSLLPDSVMPPSKRSSVSGDYLVNQEQLFKDFEVQPPAYVIIYDDVRFGLNLEKEAFVSFFDMLDSDYLFEKRIGMFLIYKRIR